MNNDFEYFNSDDFRKCLKEYERARDEGTTMFLDVNDFADIADYYNQMGNSKEAMTAINHGLDIFPGEAVLLSYIIRSDLHTDQDVQEAKKHLEMINDTIDPEYFYCMIEILLTEGKKDDADEEINKKYSEIETVEHDDFVIDIAEIYTDYLFTSDARDWLSKVFDKKSVDYKELNGRIAMVEGDYKNCIQIYQQLLDENPFSCEYWDNLASAQMQTEQYYDAIASCDYSLAISPDNQIALRNKAKALYTTGDYENAIATYDALAKITPDDAIPHLSAGAALMNMGDYSSTVMQLKDAERINSKNEDSPLNADITRELVIALSRLKKTDEALAYSEKYKEHSNNIPETNVLKGHVYLEAGDLDTAIAFFAKAVNDPMADSNTTLRIAISFYDIGETEMAYELFKEICYKIGDEKAWPYLALCAKDMGRRNEYLSCLKHACEKVPDETRLVLGDSFPVELSVAEYYDYERKK